jgi:hypothetical protein
MDEVINLATPKHVTELKLGIEKVFVGQTNTKTVSKPFQRHITRLSST